MDTEYESPDWPVVGMTIDECARVLRCNAKTVRELIKCEGLPARIVGRGYRIDIDALKAWLASGAGEGRGRGGEQESCMEEDCGRR